MDCTTVRLGPDKTTVRGTPVAYTTVRINQESRTTIQDNCLIEAVVSSDTSPKTLITLGLTTFRATEATKVVLTDIGGLGSSSGTLGPCDGYDSTDLFYTPEKRLDYMVNDGDVSTFIHDSGGLLTSVIHPDCTYTMSYNLDGTLSGIVKS